MNIFDEIDAAVQKIVQEMGWEHIKLYQTWSRNHKIVPKIGYECIKYYYTTHGIEMHAIVPKRGRNV